MHGMHRSKVYNSTITAYRPACSNSGSQGMTQRTTSPSGNWSAKVTRESFALELEEGIFTWKDPKRIAQSLKKSADTSTHRKAPPFRSAMSMLVFYINRAGKNLDENQKRILEQAKDELRALYGKG
jgi:Protein of unknown function (DUF3175)